MKVETATYVANELNTIFGVKGSEPTYSLGFQRLQKLTLKQRKLAFTALYLEGFTDITLNNNEFKNRLENMSDSEFNEFKMKLT